VTTKGQRLAQALTMSHDWEKLQKKKIPGVSRRKRLIAGERPNLLGRTVTKRHWKLQKKCGVNTRLYKKKT